MLIMSCDIAPVAYGITKKNFQQVFNRLKAISSEYSYRRPAISPIEKRSHSIRRETTTQR